MTEDEIVGIGGTITASIVLQAYAQGIFPWPMHVENEPDPMLIWYRPKRRALLPVKSIIKSKRDLQSLKNCNFHFTVDHCFERVMRECRVRPDEGTWITEDLLLAYCDLHRLGHAHSIEVWHGDALVGGLYGVDCSGVFSGESMFYRENNASKFAIWFAIKILSDAGRFALDVQVMTPHLKKWGAGTLSHPRFIKLLQAGGALPPIPWNELKQSGTFQAQLAGLSEAE